MGAAGSAEASHHCAGARSRQNLLVAIHIESTDRSGTHESVLHDRRFWIGSPGVDSCGVALDLPDFHGRALEVEVTDDGRLRIRAEAGLPFPIRSAAGTVGQRFQSHLEGDVLNVGPALVKLHYHSETGAADGAQQLDPAALQSSPGAPVGRWYETFMEVADHLEGLSEPGKIIQAALEAMLGATNAERVHLTLSEEFAASTEGRLAWHLSVGGDTKPFRFSRSLVERVQETGEVVHVPIASADPIASEFQSIRSEGISASIALPLQGLGKTLGVTYADCVRPGATLTAEDLQRLAFVTRLLASSLGNRVIVRSLLQDGQDTSASGSHWALQTKSAACREMASRVKLYASADYTVLVRGETGAGKEVIARALHELSRRAEGPFVPVNCAAIPEQLMESVLFGHEKGSFTGAANARRGHFEEAHGGTIFLDEIGDMALDLQAKILRVLQERVIARVGSSRQTKIDVRILAATHQDLEIMVGEGRFREDLFYRLRELEVVIPPLRSRLEDLPLLVERFTLEAAEDLGHSEPQELAADTWRALERHPWHGNVRELQHVVRGAALRAAGGPVRAEHLELIARPVGRPVAPSYETAPAVAGAVASGAGGSVGASHPAGDPTVESAGDSDTDATTWKEKLERQERDALESTLTETDGNLTRAAALFGVPRTTYREKLVRHGLLPGG